MNGVKNTNIFKRFLRYIDLLRKYNTLKILYETDKRILEARLRGYKGQCARLRNEIKRLKKEK